MSSTSLNKLPEISGRVMPVALIGAAILHIAIIWGVGFEHLQIRYIPPALDVVLITHATETTQDSVDFVARESQFGGGDTQRRTRPSAPATSNTLENAQGAAPKTVPPSSPKEKQINQTEVITQLTADRIEPKKEQKTASTETTRAMESLLLQRRQEIARLTAELAKDLERQASTPRTMYLTASTKKESAADYMMHWVEKVERVGNLKLPGRLPDMTGSLVMVVGLNQKGMVTEVAVKKSSGKKQLDSAAKKIVNLAAPYKPMPIELAANTDIIYITRTWVFSEDKSISTY